MSYTPFDTDAAEDARLSLRSMLHVLKRTHLEGEARPTELDVGCIKEIAHLLKQTRSFYASEDCSGSTFTAEAFHLSSQASRYAYLDMRRAMYATPAFANSLKTKKQSFVKGLDLLHRHVEQYSESLSDSLTFPKPPPTFSVLQATLETVLEKLEAARLCQQDRGHGFSAA